MLSETNASKIHLGITSAALISSTHVLIVRSSANCTTHSFSHPSSLSFLLRTPAFFPPPSCDSSNPTPTTSSFDPAPLVASSTLTPAPGTRGILPSSTALFQSSLNRCRAAPPRVVGFPPTDGLGTFSFHTVKTRVLFFHGGSAAVFFFDPKRLGCCWWDDEPLGPAGEG